MGLEQSKPETDPEVLMEMMEDNPEVVMQYYLANRELTEKYIVENFWEEDVERWLTKIRERSPAEELKVRNVDFLPGDNLFNNFTELYEHKALVVRRASHFDMDVVFGNRTFDPARDDISVVFGLGKKPAEATKTKITCPVLSENSDKATWNCTLKSTDVEEKKITLRVNIPADAIVARYSVTFKIVSGVQDGRKESSHVDNSIIVLFNPFSADDTVYMKDADKRKEYVLNEEGFVNVGSISRKRKDIRKKKWNFAQFEEGVLDCVLLMLQNDSRALLNPAKSLRKRNSPQYVCRVLAAMVNSNDDKGVLKGNWSGSYDGGMSPAYWSNSSDILREWKRSGMKPVQFGQCWVFSALLTTALRALGIPGRPVTNFASAHDTDNNMTVDVYRDAITGEILDDLNTDSIWNFHVWNEAFFRRPDLPGYDGWHVVDATPQEVSAVRDSDSGGVKLMQCGPAPVKAIKEGDIGVGLDTGFIFSEVNADKVYWLVNEDGSLNGSPVVLSRAVGLFIGTKAVGKWETENIIDQYKYKEGTPAERKAFKKAYGQGTGEHLFGEKNLLVEPAFEIVIENAETIELGEDIKSIIKVKNVSSKPRPIEVKMVANTRKHIGVIHAVLKKQVNKIELLAPGEVSEIQFDVPRDDYSKNLVDNNVVNLSVVATSSDDGNTVIEEDEITLTLPDCIEVEADELLSEEKNTFNVIFKNKLPMALSGARLVINVRGKKKEFTFSKSVQPGETVKVQGEVYPKFNWFSVYATVVFKSPEINDMAESFRMKVKR